MLCVLKAQISTKQIQSKQTNKLCVLAFKGLFIKYSLFQDVEFGWIAGFGSCQKWGHLNRDN